MTKEQLVKKLMSDKTFKTILKEVLLEVIDKIDIGVTVSKKKKRKSVDLTVSDRDYQDGWYVGPCGGNSRRC